MDFNKENIIVNATLTTVTELARYQLRVTQTNGEISDVSANVTTISEPVVNGNLYYQKGQYSIGWFPWDAEKLRLIMSDFNAVVEALKSGSNEVLTA